MMLEPVSPAACCDVHVHTGSVFSIDALSLEHGSVVRRCAGLLCLSRQSCVLCCCQGNYIPGKDDDETAQDAWLNSNEGGQER